MGNKRKLVTIPHPSWEIVPKSIKNKSGKLGKQAAFVWV